MEFDWGLKVEGVMWSLGRVARWMEVYVLGRDIVVTMLLVISWVGPCL